MNAWGDNVVYYIFSLMHVAKFVLILEVQEFGCCLEVGTLFVDTFLSKHSYFCDIGHCFRTFIF